MNAVRRIVQGVLLVWFMLLWISAGADAAWGQTTGSEVDVTVTDPSGALVPSATVQVVGALTGDVVRTITTDTNGFGAVPLLRPDTYNILVNATGFKKLIQPGVILNVGAVVHLDLKMQVGEAAQSVTVSEESPLLNTTTGTLDQIVDHETIEALPLNGRNYLQLGSLTAGTAPSNTRENSYATYGLRGSENVFMLDGALNESYMRGLDVQQRDAMRPSLEAIEEFNVETSNYSAQYGSAAGGVITAVTKSGTNQIHGSVFEFLRNDLLDARNRFATTGKKPMLRQNQFGGSLGGPIRRDKAWIFGAFQGTRINTDDVYLGTVPTVAMKSGQFPGAIYDPSTTTQLPNGTYMRTQFANNTITTFDPIGATLVKEYPNPNLSGTANNYQSAAPDDQSFNNATFRNDIQLSSRSSMFARLSFNLGTENVQPQIPPPANSAGADVIKEWGVGYGYTHTFSPTLVNEARFGWNRIYLDKVLTLARNPVVANALYTGLNGTPVFTPSGYIPIGSLNALNSGSIPTTRVSGVFDISDNVSKILGRHSLKLGFDTQYARISDYTANSGLARGSFSFTGNYTQNPQSPSGTGNGIADMLLGLAQTAQTGSPLESDERGHSFALYAQDDWNVNEALTLNLGLRYDVFLPETEINNKLGNFIINPHDAKFGQILYAGLNGNPRGLETVAKTNIGPRFGFAYKVQKISGLVIRGGSGLFFSNPDSNVGVVNRMVNNPPFAGVGGINLTGDLIHPSTAFSLSNSTLPVVPAPTSPSSFVFSPTATYSGLVAWPDQYTSPYALEWNLSVEKQLPGQINLEIAYVGNHAVHLWGNFQGNQPLQPGPGTVNSRRALAQFTIASISEVQPFAGSNYEGFSARAEKRMGHGVYFLGSFTHGHAIDQMSSSGTGYTNNVSTVQNTYNLKSMRANADFDFPNRFVFSGIWQLPFGPSRAMVNHGPAAAIVGGWDLSGIWTDQSGSPVTLIENSNTANVGTVTWPNRTCSGALSHPTVQEWFDLTCFPAPAQYTFGNAGRNPVFGPGEDNVDFSAARNFGFPFVDAAHIEFRGELFNALNHPSYGQPISTLGAPGAGSITNTNLTNREIQASLKVVW